MQKMASIIKKNFFTLDRRCPGVIFHKQGASADVMYETKFNYYHPYSLTTYSGPAASFHLC